MFYIRPDGEMFQTRINARPHQDGGVELDCYDDAIIFLTPHEARRLGEELITAAKEW